MSEYPSYISDGRYNSVTCVVICSSDFSPEAALSRRYQGGADRLSRPKIARSRGLVRVGWLQHLLKAMDDGLVQYRDAVCRAISHGSLTPSWKLKRTMHKVRSPSWDSPDWLKLRQHMSLAKQGSLLSARGKLGCASYPMFLGFPVPSITTEPVTEKCNGGVIPDILRVFVKMTVPPPLRTRPASLTGTMFQSALRPSTHHRSNIALPRRRKRALAVLHRSAKPHPLTMSNLVPCQSYATAHTYPSLVTRPSTPARTPLVPGNMGVAASDRLGPPYHLRHQTRLNPGNQVVSQPLHSANVDAFLRPRSSLQSTNQTSRIPGFLGITLLPNQDRHTEYAQSRAKIWYFHSHCRNESPCTAMSNLKTTHTLLPEGDSIQGRFNMKLDCWSVGVIHYFITRLPLPHPTSTHTQSSILLRPIATMNTTAHATPMMLQKKSSDETSFPVDPLDFSYN
ncbi:uncharacterized protein CLUP02_03196 [Colletotrichum lupini]|uniref:Uncharacterized protein n=1 Tax=Colletotrichum lupini TaxID=145971 RepID=A0A9Q8SIS4_9PEZI|nr:uncharacterized protein CLUP02_03196 [Colletotrichum lupini]UQC77725.1 hypothetical protein CLUP02_03196 [Colletotrichum lupini]